MRNICVGIGRQIVPRMLYLGALGLPLWLAFAGLVTAGGSDWRGTYSPAARPAPTWCGGYRSALIAARNAEAIGLCARELGPEWGAEAMSEIMGEALERALAAKR